MTNLVTAGVGFVGSSFVLDTLDAGGAPPINLDALTYASNARCTARFENTYGRT